MKISYKRELPQISIKVSFDIDFKEFINVYKKCTAKPDFFVVGDTTLASGNPLER